MRKHNFGIFLLCTILFLTFGVFNKHNSQTTGVLSESKIKTYNVTRSEDKKESESTSVASSKTQGSTPTPTPSATNNNAGNNSTETNSNNSVDENNTNNVTNNTSQTSAYITPTPTPEPEPQHKGGIAGQITIGPTCGGPIHIDSNGNIEPDCEDKPFSTDIVVKSQDGSSEIARTTSGEDGYYSINVDPGTYLVIAGPDNDSPYPSKASQTVTVNQETIQVSFSLDSGIR